MRPDGGPAGPAAPPEWFSRVAALPGRVQAGELFGPLPVPDGGGRASAVLMLFGESDHGPDVLLTQRAAGLRSHPGQVSFPGGAVDDGDAGPEAAALREASEETGLDPGGVQISGSLPPLHLSVSGYTVTPVLAWWHTPAPVAPMDHAEVAAVVRVPLAELVDPANRFQVRHPSGYLGPGFSAGGLFVWGFTAGLLSRVLELAELDRPWDTSRLMPLPGLPGLAAGRRVQA